MGQALSIFVSWISGKATIQNRHYTHLDEKSPLYANYTANEKPTYTDRSPTAEEEDMAAQLVDTIFTSPSLPDLHAQLQNTINAQSWTETLASAILSALTKALEIGAPMGNAVKEAYDKANADVAKWATEHPKLAAVLVVVIAIGILVVVMPWVIDALGFEAVGPRVGEFDALFCVALGCFALRKDDGREELEDQEF